MPSAQSISPGCLVSASYTFIADKMMNLVFEVRPVRCLCILVPAVDIGSAIWNLISRNKGSLQTLLSVRKNSVKCLFSIGTIVQGCFHFNNHFRHLGKDICHIWVWYDPDWVWSGGNDHKGWDTYQFNLQVSIHISESYIPTQKTCLFCFVPRTGFQSQTQIIGMSFHTLVLLKQRAKINQFFFTF